MATCKARVNFLQDHKLCNLRPPAMLTSAVCEAINRRETIHTIARAAPLDSWRLFLQFSVKNYPHDVDATTDLRMQSKHFTQSVNERVLRHSNRDTIKFKTDTRRYHSYKWQVGEWLNQIRWSDYVEQASERQKYKQPTRVHCPPNNALVGSFNQ